MPEEIVDEIRAYSWRADYSGHFRFDMKYPVRIALVQSARGNGWRTIESDPPPEDEMFIWAVPKGDGKWNLGLAYRNVSGGWSDAYGSDAPDRATHWAPLPEPPSLTTGKKTDG